MNIKVIGTGCDKCDALYANLGLQADIEKVEDLVQIVRLGVMQSPSLMVDGRLVSAGRELKTKQVEKLLKKAL